jgi:hypothetical protein
MKGVYFHTGRSVPHRVTTEGLEQIDVGQLYITSKRIIFTGTRENRSIPLPNLLGFHVYADGLHLEKASGKSPTIKMSGDVELAAVILGARLAASG